MFPVLFQIGGISISSLGAFLIIGFFLAIFLVWRLARAWDLDEEKVLDLILLTFVGEMIFGRIYFILSNFQLFGFHFLKWLLVTKYPGFSFGGGILGGALILYIFARRFKLNFWQLADIASVGLLGGVILSDLGCFFGGCNIGLKSNLFFAVPMVGVIGKRWPVQIIEALFLCLSLIKIWGNAVHFHIRGKIVSLTLILLGLTKLILVPLKEPGGQDIFLNLLLTVLGMTIFYKVTKRNIVNDLRNAFKFMVSKKMMLQYISKTWYNQKVYFSWKFRNIKKLLRRLNVKVSYKTD